MEVNTQRRAQGLRDKIPDIKKTLEMVRFLKLRRENESASALETNFELNDTLYARATVSPADTEEVYLWLGANVMLAYPIEEAESMLDEKLAAAQKSLGNCEEDLEFLREQITVCSIPFYFTFGVFCLGFRANGLCLCRRWRLRRQESIIGMWCRDGKKRLKVRVMRKRRRRLDIIFY